MEEEVRKMSMAEFWIRFVAFFLLAVVAPFTFLAISYGIFDNKEGESVSLSGWGILGLAICAIVIISILSQAKKGLPYGNMFRQCIEGYSKIIPLVIFIVIIHAVKANIDKLETFLIFLAICESVAIPINPIQKWAQQNNIEIAENFLMKCIRRAIGKSS